MSLDERIFQMRLAVQYNEYCVDRALEKISKKSAEPLLEGPRVGPLGRGLSAKLNNFRVTSKNVSRS